MLDETPSTLGQGEEESSLEQFTQRPNWLMNIQWVLKEPQN
jgi:hypothetical protein